MLSNRKHASQERTEALLPDAVDAADGLEHHSSRCAFAHAAVCAALSFVHASRI